MPIEAVPSHQFISAVVGQRFFESAPREMRQEQLGRFTPESLLMRSVGEAPVDGLIDRVRQAEGKEIVVFDIGGTAIKVNLATITDGAVVIDPTKECCEESKYKGRNYLPFMRQVADWIGDLPVGISTAGVVENGVLVDSPNLPGFFRPLQKMGGMQQLFKQNKVTLLNDAVAGLYGGATEVRKIDASFMNYIYLIFGGGIGGSAMKNGREIFSMEPGHVEADRLLNLFKITAACGLFGQQHTCIERLASMGSIEAQWKATHGRKLSGKRIAGKMYKGSVYAECLFQTSAVILAHAIEGIRSSMEFAPERTAVVIHGGGSKVTGMVEEIGRILSENNTSKEGMLQLVTAESLGCHNPCMTGAAIASCYKGKELYGN